MTNAEAIERLRANYPDACYEQLREAVDAAIEALKAQDAVGDTISRRAAIDALKDLEFCHYMECGEYIGEDTREVCLIRAEKAQDALQSLPAADVQPVRHGKWIWDGFKDSPACSACGHMTLIEYDYCPSCGACMKEED